MSLGTVGRWVFIEPAYQVWSQCISKCTSKSAIKTVVRCDSTDSFKHKRQKNIIPPFADCRQIHTFNKVSPSDIAKIPHYQSVSMILYPLNKVNVHAAAIHIDTLIYLPCDYEIGKVYIWTYTLYANVHTQTSN